VQFVDKKFIGPWR